jgi:hypothetical protein
MEMKEDNALWSQLSATIFFLRKVQVKWKTDTLYLLNAHHGGG